MNPQHHNILEQYLDNELPATERSAVQSELSVNPQVKEQLAALYASAEAIRYYGISQQIAAIQQEFLASKQTTASITAKKPAVVINIIRPAMKVAAVIVLMIGIFGVYKFTTLSASGVSQEYYAPYELNRTRGEVTASTLESSFNNKDFTAVITLVNQMAEPGSKELFLAGSAYFELNQPAQAIAKFNSVIAHNQRTQSNYFQDEAEYYLALSYIKNNEAAKAIPVLRKIRADKQHLFYEKANEMSMLDLRILSLKKS